MSEGSTPADSDNTVQLPPIESTAWLNPSNDVILPKETLEVWRMEINPDITLSRAAFLGPDDCDRAGRMIHAGRRAEFIAGRLLLREIQNHHASQPLHASLSHSRNWVVASVSPSGPVGVDIEWIDTLRPHSRLAGRFFGSVEQTLYARLSSEDQPLFFYRLWTAKEALFKATGLPPKIRHFAERPIFSEPATAQISIRVQLDNLIVRWFTAAPGFIGACVMPPEISCLKFYSVTV